MSSVPFGHPLRFFRSASFFLWKVINLADSPGWVKKSPRVRGGFFSVLDVGGLWDGFTVFRVCV